MTNSSKPVISVRNPWSGKIDYQIVPPSEEEVHETCVRLRENQRAWGAAPLAHRIEVLSEWADHLEKAHEDLTNADAADTGYAKISKVSTMFVVATIRGWCMRAEAAIGGLHREGNSMLMPNVSYRTQLVPHSLVGVISPWNGPFLLSMIDLVPALVAGCAVLAKPSEVAPRFVAPLRRTIDEVPELAGVLSYIVGDKTTGQVLVEEVDAVFFTGSVATGRLVGEACGRRLIPAYLELGGNDPVIVTRSADIEATASTVLRGATFGTGQGCAALERIYVHEDIHDSFVDSLVRKSEEVTLNYPDRDNGDLGPFIFERQAAIVDDHLDDAVAKGAKVRTGGKSEKLGGGIFMRPVVLTEVTHDMKVMREETFGPVMPVMAYRSEEEAIRLANDTPFGLSASVIARTPEEAARLGEQINAGDVTLQDGWLAIATMPDIGSDPFGCSGLGQGRGGPGAIRRYFKSKALLTNSKGPAQSFEWSL